MTRWLLVFALCLLVGSGVGAYLAVTDIWTSASPTSWLPGGE